LTRPAGRYRIVVMEVSNTSALLGDNEMRGEAQRYWVEHVLAGQKIKLSEVAQRGVLSLDVGHGPEIAAFAPFKPVPFIVTERNQKGTAWGDVDASLEVMAAAFPQVTILRGSVTEHMRDLIGRKQTFGLITYLYINPDDGRSYEYMKQAFSLIDPLLKPGGVMVASVQWVDPDESFGTDFLRAGNLVFGRGGLGYNFDMPDTNRDSSAGGIFVVAQKPGDSRV
jgi:hypothetical protein